MKTTKSHVLRAIVKLSRLGYPPSVREIAKEVGVSSTNTVDYHIRALVADRSIRRIPNVARGIVLL